MNPLRTFFLAASRTPPAVLVGGIVITGAVTALLVANGEKTRDDQYRATIDEMRSKQSARTKVVFSLAQIPEASTIKAEQLEEKEIEMSRAPQDALSAASLAIGRTAKYGIGAGQIVSNHDLAPLGISLGFDAKLKEGMRAVTFAVDSNSAVAGFVAPDSHVDIMAMVGNGADTKVSPILSDVEIIAVGQNYERKGASLQNGGAPNSVTVQLSPVDAQKLVRAVAASKLYLSLRSDHDHTPIATVDVTSLFAKSNADTSTHRLASNNADLTPPPLPLPTVAFHPGENTNGLNISAPPAPPLHAVEIWSGSKKDVLDFPTTF